MSGSPGSIGSRLEPSEPVQQVATPRVDQLVQVPAAAVSTGQPRLRSAAPRRRCRRRRGTPPAGRRHPGGAGTAGLGGSRAAGAAARASTSPGVAARRGTASSTLLLRPPPGPRRQQPVRPARPAIAPGAPAGAVGVARSRRQARVDEDHRATRRGGGQRGDVQPGVAVRHQHQPARRPALRRASPASTSAGVATPRRERAAPSRRGRARRSSSATGAHDRRAEQRAGQQHERGHGVHRQLRPAVGDAELGEPGRAAVEGGEHPGAGAASA